MKQKTNSITIFSESSFRSFSLMVVVVLLLSSPLLLLNKELPTFWLNAFHTPFFDKFFYYITYLGDGLILLPVFLWLLCRNYVLAGFFAILTILEAVFVQLILKKGLFAYLDRPSAYIPNFDELHQVADVHIHNLHTFPSGHTQTIFLVVTFIVLAAKKNSWFSFVMLLIAVFTGLSRVYILQHFFIDVWFGALIGFGLPIIVIYLLQIIGKYPKSEKALKCGFLS